MRVLVKLSECIGYGYLTRINLIINKEFLKIVLKFQEQPTTKSKNAALSGIVRLADILQYFILFSNNLSLNSFVRPIMQLIIYSN